MSSAVRQALRAVWWEDGVRYVDARRLPAETIVTRASSAGDVLAAIGAGAVCGARSVDLCAAFAIVLAHADPSRTPATIESVRAAAISAAASGSITQRVAGAAEGSALAIALECATAGVTIDDAIAQHGARLVPASGHIITLGSSGALATAGSGTAAAAIAAAWRSGKRFVISIGESRPWCDGRLTAYELAGGGVPCAVVADSALAALCAGGGVAAVFVGADAVGPNGDVRATLGTYAAALAAAQHRVALYAFAARCVVESGSTSASTQRLRTPSAELREAATIDGSAAERAYFDRPTDITPGHLIAGIVTEYGVMRPPYLESLPALHSRPSFTAIARLGGANV